MGTRLNLDKLILYLLVAGVVVFGIIRFTEKDKEPAVDLNNEFKKQEQIINTIDNTITDYNEKSSNRAKQTKKNNEKSVKKIDNIPNLNTVERDSLWTILLTSEDSIPGRYWDILEKQSRRKSSASF